MLQLSSKGTGYIKVQLPLLLAEGKSLHAQVTQYDMHLQGDQPSIDVQYKMLHFDEQFHRMMHMVRGWMATIPIGPTTPWFEVPKGTRVGNVYIYKPFADFAETAGL